MMGQMNMFGEEEDKVIEVKEGQYCSYSEHSCNKTYRFTVAEGLSDEEDYCPSVCCRSCSNIDCGVRCQGAHSSKPYLTKAQVNAGFRDCGKGNYPWPENRSDFYDVRVVYRYSQGHKFTSIEVDASYNNFEFALWGLPKDVPKSGQVIGWKYIEGR